MADWSTEHISELKLLHAEKFSFSKIAYAINEKYGTSFTRSATIGQAHRQGLMRGHTPAKVRPPARAMRVATISINSGVLVPIESAPAPVLRCIEIEPLHVALLDLEANGCRYPYGDGPFTFCGHPKAQGSSYCLAHHALSHTKSMQISDEERMRRRINFNVLRRKQRATA